MRIKAFISLGLVSLLVLCAAPVYANGIPALPHAFHGTVTINYGSAPAGTVIEASVTGGTTDIPQNPLTTTVSGEYGSGGSYLLVQGDILDGATITFYVNGRLATTDPATVLWHSGETSEVDLAIIVAVPSGNGNGAPSAAPDIETDLFGVEGDFSIDEDGEIQETIEATSDAGDFTITIPEGTIALDENGDPLSTLTVEVDLDPPDPPTDAHIIGIPYKLGPLGATFSPPIIIEFIVDPATLPPDIDVADLVIAYYDEVAGEWVEIPTTYDPATNTFTGEVDHFTVFAVIARAPAAFSLSSLSVYPTEVEPGETVTITVSIANTGGTEGDYTVVLTIDGVKEAEESVTVAAGDSEDVSFTVSREDAGSYSVVVDGLSRRFTVVAPPPPVPPAVPPVVPPAVPEVKPPTNWPLIGGIIAGVVAGAVGGAIWYRRRRRLG